MGSKRNSKDSTKFKVCNVQPRRVKVRAECECDLHSEANIFSELKPYEAFHCTEVLMQTKFSDNMNVTGCSKNGFVNTVIDCYNGHHNLVIRPDDIWTAILTQFSFYINKHAEEFRSQFVNFKGQKKLEVTLYAPLRSARYDDFVDQMTEKIHENLVDDTMKDWILPNFTTTTRDDSVACGVIFMATLKKYFKYSCRLACGIPYITLEGTVADWEKILKKIEKLKSYKLEKWYKMLEPILKQFIAAKKGKVDLDFWNKICSHQSRMSGSIFISGWLTAFVMFDKKGTFALEHDYEFKSLYPKINIADIALGIVSVDVEIKDDINGGIYKSVLIAGHVAKEVLEDCVTVRPRIGWGIALKGSAKEINEAHKSIRGEGHKICPQCCAQL